MFVIAPKVLSAAPNDGFAKVHYGFILKSENKIEESIPYLRVMLTVLHACREMCKVLHEYVLFVFRRVWKLEIQELMMEDFTFTWVMPYSGWEIKV